MKMKFIIEPHTTIDKSFSIRNSYIYMDVDYDDVNHAEVDVAADMVKNILEKYWDESQFKNNLKQRMIDIWKENRYNLQDDYESFDDYMAGC